RIGLGPMSDLDIWRHADRTRACLITKDEDFVALAGKEVDGPKVVWIRIGNISNAACGRRSIRNLMRSSKR
ncbi:MAG: DUF5615 family PIN-like protein, partial [Xanthobacteraceae bacterium]